MLADQNGGENADGSDPSDFSIRSELSRSFSSLEEDLEVKDPDPWSALRARAGAMDDPQCPESPAGAPEQPDGAVVVADSPDCKILDPPGYKCAAGDSKPPPPVDQVLALLKAVKSKMMTKQPASTSLAFA